MRIAKEKYISENIHEASLLKVDEFDNAKNVQGRLAFLNSLDIDYTYNDKSLKEIILDDILKDNINKRRDFNKTLFSRKFKKKKKIWLNNLSQKFKNIFSTRFK